MLMKKLLPMFLACCSVAIAEPQVRVGSYVFEFPSMEVDYLGENADGTPRFSGMPPISIRLANEPLENLLPTAIEQLKAVDSKGNDLLARCSEWDLRSDDVRITTVYPARGAWVKVSGTLCGRMLGEPRETETKVINLQQGGDIALGEHVAHIRYEPHRGPGLVAVLVNFPSDIISDIVVTSPEDDALEVSSAYSQCVGTYRTEYYKIEDMPETVSISLRYTPVLEEVRIPFSFRISLNGVQYAKKKEPQTTAKQ